MLVIIGLRLIQIKIAPIIAVPTTAGTGSETGRASVILNKETGVKNIIFHPKFLPSIVILDPVLTVGLPCKDYSCNRYGCASSQLGGILCSRISPNG